MQIRNIESLKTESNNIDAIIKDLDAILEINKASIEQLVEREIKLSLLEEMSFELVEMSKKFHGASIEARKKEEPWYYKYKYYIGSASTVLGTVLFYLL